MGGCCGKDKYDVDANQRIGGHRQTEGYSLGGGDETHLGNNSLARPPASARKANNYNGMENGSAVGPIEQADNCPDVDQVSTSASYSFSGRLPSAEMPYMTPPPLRHTESVSSGTVSEPTASKGKREVSYNKISVRERLAEVLAERAVLEHHYTEVEEDSASSLYEEIAGSNNSSVTYTKIGDIVAQSSSTLVLDSNVSQEMSRIATPSVETERCSLCDSVELHFCKNKPKESDCNDMENGSTSSSFGLLKQAESCPDVDQVSTSASFAVSGRIASAEIPYMTPPPFRHPSDSDSSDSGSDVAAPPGKKEVSYNKISVREPLAKVLAERAALEHHYTEVDEEEAASSLYEEIAGSTNSSVTYTKIGDIKPQSSPTLALDTSVKQAMSPPPPPSVESLMVVAESSRSTSALQPTVNHQNNEPNTSYCDVNDVNISAHDLYSSVNKVNKIKNRHSSAGISSSNNIDDLYARVHKNSGISARSSRLSSPLPSVQNNKSSTRTLDAPPPLPPPLNVNMSRSLRAVSLYDANLMYTTERNHHRSYSSGNDSLKYQNMNDSTRVEEPGYESVKLEYASDEEDGYEQIKRKQSQIMNRVNQTNSNDVVVDPGYETVKYESDAEPAYETISKVTRNNSEIADPGYEVIKRPKRKFQRSLSVQRNESDVSNEPGYERVRYVYHTNIQIDHQDQEPPYAIIVRKDDDREFSERL